MSSIPFINEDRASPWKPVAVLSQPYISVPSLTTAVCGTQRRSSIVTMETDICYNAGGYFLTEQRVLGPLLHVISNTFSCIIQLIKQKSLNLRPESSLLTLADTNFKTSVNLRLGYNRTYW
jgi:hypothetical protein